MVTSPESVWHRHWGSHFVDVSPMEMTDVFVMVESLRYALNPMKVLHDVFLVALFWLALQWTELLLSKISNICHASSPNMLSDTLND